MKQFSIKLQFVLIGMLYGTLCSAPAFAEDIEIYTGATGISTEATSNILFVLDTSGSMGGGVVTSSGYDPSETYSGCFDRLRLYTNPKFDSFIIATTNFTGPQMYCHPSGPANGYDITQIDQFIASNFKCDKANGATGPLATNGNYIDRIAYYRSSRWRSMNRIKDYRLSYDVECKADQGFHGNATGDGMPYAVNGSKWTSDSSSVLSWNSSGSSETVYTGNFMNYLTLPLAEAATRIRIMQNALTDVVSAAVGTNINIGLMRYSSNGNGGLVVSPLDKIDNPAHTADFLQELGKITHDGSTPLAETYYEAVRYMQGGAVDYGSSSTATQFINPGVTNDIEEVARSSVDASRTVAGGTNYKSPISDTCQKNYIVLLTDGVPSSSDNPGSKLTNIGVTGGCSAIGTSSCLEEIADSIGSKDQNTLVNGDQVISTFTIGLDIEEAAALLEGTAAASDAASEHGKYYAADNSISLTAAFANIVTQVLDTNATFASPAVSVNAFNRSTHLDDLFFTVFKPGEEQHWDGNLKKYKLKFFTDTDDVDGDNDTTELLPFIADNNSNSPAIHETTGFFKKAAVSYWTDVDVIGADGEAVGPDGDNVLAGGSLSVMSATRNVYTTTGSYNLSNGVFVPTTQLLTSAENAVDQANASLTDAMLGTTGFPEKVTGIDYRTTLLDWASGLDVQDLDRDGVTTDAFQHMGDPLHAEPALVQYGGTLAAPELVAYVATNDGYLHAVDVKDTSGQELFSFIPQELLTNLTVALENDGRDKLYGLDGSVVAWVKEDSGVKGVIDGTDHVYLYVGMRRGGRNIYALDVTLKTQPKLLWVIKGGFGDYAELGETWSTINVEKIKDGGTEKTVLIFGGGYDNAQDGASVRTPDPDMGRAVFIADATSGERLWMGSATGGNTTLSEMQYSIPARIKPLDISGDGFVDRLYAADTGGQIFRFDIDNTSGAALSGSITGGRIADLAGTDATSARRFFYPPDVALVDDPSGKYHGLVISSGYRAHPLNEEIHDRIYMLKDKKTGLISTGYDLITESALKDVTDNLAGGDSGVLGDATADAARKAELGLIAAAQGWYIDLDDEATGNWVGEKGLAEPLIIEGTAVVTTYVPDFTVTPDSCAPQAGRGKVFFLEIIDATPAFPQDIDKRPQRHIDLKRGGIPPSPNVIITDSKVPTLCVGTECEQANFGLGVRRTYWYEVEK